MEAIRDEKERERVGNGLSGDQLQENEGNLNFFWRRQP